MYYADERKRKENIMAEVINNGVTEGAAAPNTATNSDSYMTWDDQEFYAGANDVNSGVTGEAAAPTKSKQAPEIDSAFAKMRKELESKDKTLGEVSTLLAEMYGEELGLEQGKSLEEVIGALKSNKTNKKLDEYREAGYDPEIIQEIWKASPEYQEFQQQKEYLKQQQQSQKMAEDFLQIQREFKDWVKTPEDISPEVWSKFDTMGPGASLYDAFKLVNDAEITKRRAAATKQQTLNTLNSKQHLKTEGDGADESVDVYVPEATLSMYMDMGMSRKDAMKYHKRLYG